MNIWYQSYTDPEEHREYMTRLADFLETVKEPQTRIRLEGLVPSAKHVHGLTEFRCADRVIRNAIQAEREGYDGFVIGHFQDAGLHEARSAVDIPVVGLGESTMLRACSIGRKIGLITIDTIFIPWHEDQVVRYGLQDRVVAIRAIDTKLEEFMQAFATEQGYRLVLERFHAQVAPVVAGGVDVVIPAGGLPMLLLSREPGMTIDGAPVINGIPIALKTCELAIKLQVQGGPAVSRAGSYARPPSRSLEEFLAPARPTQAAG